jgi:cell division protein FtsX
LIIFTNIKWQVLNQAQQIKVYLLLGATRSHILLPFAYSALWLALGGCLLGILWHEVALLLSNWQLSELAPVGETNHFIDGIGFVRASAYVGLGFLLALLGSSLAVRQEIRQLNRLDA